MCFIDCLIIHKRNVDNLLRLRNLRYRQTPCNLKRANAHALQRELSTSVLDYLSVNWRFFRLQESKSGCSSYMSFTKYLSLSHRHEGLMFNNMVVCFRLQRYILFLTLPKECRKKLRKFVLIS